MSALCPHCGYNLEADAIIESGGWRIDPRGLVTFDDRRVPLSPAQSVILHSIAKGCGRPVSTHVLIMRTGTDADDADNCIRVLISRIRSILRDLRIPVPFAAPNRNGYIWGAA